MVLSSSLRALNKAEMANKINLFWNCGFGLLLCYIFTKINNWGIKGIYYGESIGFIGCIISQLFLLIKFDYC
jgi:Na+-driven multidrug efflux pump